MTTEAEQVLGEEIRFHRRFARPGTIVDVGAHTGDFCLALADLPGIDLVAIEPLPHALAILRERVAESGCPIRIIPAALSDAPGTATLNVPVLAGSGPVWPWASMVKDFSALRADHAEIVDIQSYTVDVATLDTVSLTHVTALKVDAEGAEYEVLRGGRSVLATLRPIISVELEERHRPGCTYAVPAFLGALGYQGFFNLSGDFRPFAEFNRQSMQHGSPSPASHQYSRPYIGSFYFLPQEDVQRMQHMQQRSNG